MPLAFLHPRVRQHFVLQQAKKRKSPVKRLVAIPEVTDIVIPSPIKLKFRTPFKRTPKTDKRPRTTMGFYNQMSSESNSSSPIRPKLRTISQKRNRQTRYFGNYLDNYSPLFTESMISRPCPLHGYIAYDTNTSRESLFSSGRTSRISNWDAVSTKLSRITAYSESVARRNLKRSMYFGATFIVVDSS